ncbi:MULTISPECIES: UDP-N-acetylglucosamine 1-carboxyvinyltransferase [unclassified Microcoleus]|uniref:UDP-N-acetylglucosamine 1-carboxyvinyltransferase n=1 Tax=unclassified Microcoleus TaxID=2642155 RepID=UPI001D1A608D|nr:MULTISPECIES: UDP-N-acetylglucosamine 1-carboxyvinyltransferase [unclassified Microcoleus]MCC3417897.1 UDP-N-acetylglucosamine 1-carboxyvinyltransferase [Microcoleus sp. PH2017_07_MST_O_A]MCC3431252.1 UDP-N-acetylglucosamine 1-carboxyvinyltransferase [Microcoleus sp. PH2017_04_SCI_O_A]MCC3444868.1 UDP-N-acetylglucosamine 1-carboxyvinyltransferase [Microcoleus sp. PH2017_03_ELD_O_A]MCC3466742.1 UDP-N-acetylglucosamine 1-carboxyvinyltransferase [Microcoleus sp. PH2017_06_SFM_O_A]MCC3505427.1 
MYKVTKRIMEGKPITPAQNSSNLSASPESDQQVLQIWGRQPLKGHVKISGAKNSALVVMAGAILCPDDCHIRNVPALVDVARMGQILSAVGVKVQQNGDTLDINASNLLDAQAPYELVSQLRASFFIIGPLLARLGFAKVPLPGGCAIGARPVELHVRGLQALGAEVHIDHGTVNAYVKGPNRRLKGAKIYLDYPSVGATETLMMAATLAEGETVIENAAQEPEVVDLANFCRAMGAKIQGAGTNTIVISGVEKLHAVDYAIIPDRIEAGTFLLAGAITHSEISLSSVIPDHLTAVIAKLQTMGAKIIVESDIVRIVPGKIHTATDIETLPYPGFSTDMQAPFMALLTLSEGDSLIKETVFENRLRHVAELNRMGADIRVKGNVAVVRGVPMLSGAPVVATDLRASAALVIAGLAADGVTTISSLQHLDRGYEQLEMKLQKLGAKLRRVKEGTDPATAEAPVNLVRSSLNC